MLKCNHHPIPFLFLKVKNICYQSVDVQRIWHCKSAEVSTRIPCGLPAQRFKSLIRRSSLVGWVKSVQKKWKNMGKPGGKHRKHIGNVGKPWEKPWEKPILHFRNPRKQGCPGVRSCSLRPTQWGKIEKSFQDGKQKDVFLSFFRIASVLSIWIYLAIVFFYGGMFIFYLQSLRREANSHTAHEKKHISLLLCIIPKHKGRG